MRHDLGHDNLHVQLSPQCDHEAADVRRVPVHKARKHAHSVPALKQRYIPQAEPQKKNNTTIVANMCDLAIAVGPNEVVPLLLMEIAAG